MRVISFHIKIISRSEGRSAIQMSAYCARDKRYSSYAGTIYDYTDRKDLVYHEVMLPSYVSQNFLNPECLWNSVEKVERCRNSQLARSITIAIPKEFDHDTQIRLVKDYVWRNFVLIGMCAEVSIHDKGVGNPHVHILLTTRSIDKNGEWMQKQYRNYLLDEQGNRIRNPSGKGYKLGKSIKVNDWDDCRLAEKWRELWADACNKMFREMNITENGRVMEVTHMSYQRQGLDKVPTIHLGARASALERQGVYTRRGETNREIENRNKAMELKRLREQLEPYYDREIDRKI